MFDASRREFLFTLSALGLAGLVGCGQPQRPLKIASQVWPGFEFLFLARDLGWLNAGETQLIEVTDATDSLQLLEDGLIDGAAFTLDEVLRARTHGVPLTVVAVFDVSAGADVLLARPGIENLAGLRGKRIAVEETALGGMILAHALQLAELTVDQVSIVHAGVEQHEALWQSGKVDALITYAPVSGKLERMGAWRLLDSRAMPDRIVDVLAVKPESIQIHGNVLRHLLAANFRAQAYFRDHLKDASYRMAARLAVNPDEVNAIFEGLRLTDLTENRRLLAARDTPLLATAKVLADQLLAQQLIPQADELQSLFDNRFLSAGGFK